MDITILEVLIKGVPEAIIMTFAVCILTNTVIKLKDVFFTAGIFAAITYFIRLLPTNVGFHTIIMLFVLILLSNLHLKIEVLKATKSILQLTMIVLFCEGLNIFILTLIFGDQLSYQMTQSEVRHFYGIPSTVCFALSVLGIYLFKMRRKKKLIGKVESE